ncbi:protein translocase subunit SecF [bacterium]|nr:protein translocase subunit SecF [bacterium]
MYNIIGKRKIFLSISGVLCAFSLFALIFWGLKPGIDFTGGTMMQVKFAKNQLPPSDEIKKIFNDLDIKNVKVQSAGENNVILKFKPINENAHQEILKKLKNAEELRYELIGPTIGQELTSKARSAVILAVIAILIYIAWAFRKLSDIMRKSESWRYGTGAILALIHDTLIVTGLYAVLGHFFSVEIDIAFITAILTVLGYSVNDTIVVYDRIRENILNYGSRNLEETINKSLNETIVRSLNTSLTTLFTLLAIYFFGGTSIKIFTLAMSVGVAVGTWSSIAIATSFLLFRNKTIKVANKRK